MPLIPFPDIPELPGVPALPRSPNFPPIVKTGLGLIEGALWRALQIDSKWGVYDSKGKALGDPAKFTGVLGAALDAAGVGSTLSTGSVEYTKATRVSDFPVEKGSFASYNKVEVPGLPVVTLCLTGSESDRTAFLNSIDTATKSTDLYSVVTPEVTYVNYSIEAYNYQRRAVRGVTLLTVELMLKEVRQVSAQYSSTQISINTSLGNAYGHTFGAWTYPLYLTAIKNVTVFPYNTTGYICWGASDYESLVSVDICIMSSASAASSGWSARVEGRWR